MLVLLHFYRCGDLDLACAAAKVHISCKDPHLKKKKEPSKQNGKARYQPQSANPERPVLKERPWEGMVEFCYYSVKNIT